MFVVKAIYRVRATVDRNQWKFPFDFREAELDSFAELSLVRISHCALSPLAKEPHIFASQMTSM